MYGQAFLSPPHMHTAAGARFTSACLHGMIVGEEQGCADGLRADSQVGCRKGVAVILKLIDGTLRDLAYIHTWMNNNDI